jgi:hypothetical protein
MVTAKVVSYLRWEKDVAEHDYAAASSYLSIRFGERRAEQVAAGLRKLPVISRRANDILRATGRDPLPLSDPGVLKDLKKVLAGDKLSPILVAEGDIADGYHRLSLAYALDPYATVPLKLGGVTAAPLRAATAPLGFRWRPATRTHTLSRTAPPEGVRYRYRRSAHEARGRSWTSAATTTPRAAITARPTWKACP